MREELLTIKEAAWELTISESTMRRLLDSKRIMCLKISDGCVRIEKDELKRYLKELKNGIH